MSSFNPANRRFSQRYFGEQRTALSCSECVGLTVGTHEARLYTEADFALVLRSLVPRTSS